jgi:hypothetical protein
MLCLVNAHLSDLSWQLILVSRSDLFNKIDEIGCCDRLFGQFVLIGYSYRFGAWLMHLFMVQVEVQVGAWLVHLFMVQVDYRFFGAGWCMVDALVYVTG